ncbi:MAG: hypothetical protein Q4G46_12850 [Propionibacteriaceae bacterium]|nr:hypothetical protein [Propionibacteriaceae bacterium]
MGGAVGFVESPAQLLNVVEWVAATGADARIVILGPGEPVTRFQLHRLTDLVRRDGFDVQWAEVRGGPAQAARTLGRLVRLVRSADAIVLGDPYAAFSHILLTAAGARARLVVVDDGTATVRYAEQWASGAPLQRWHVAHRGVPHRVVGLRAEQLLGRRSDRVELFSAMPLSTELPVTANTYAWVRTRCGPPRITDGTDLMGTSLVETGVVAEEAYLTGIARLISQRAVARYLPHRHESADKLAAIEALGVRIVRPDLPMEVYARRGPIGHSILSFPSTVLHTLPLVLADTSVTIEALAVEDEWFSPSASTAEKAFVQSI